MPRKRMPYPPEFRRQMVELVRSGRTTEELSREFEPRRTRLPVVAPAFAIEVADIIREHDCGILVDTSSPEEIAAALRELRSIRNCDEPWDLGVARRCSVP